MNTVQHQPEPRSPHLRHGLVLLATACLMVLSSWLSGCGSDRKTLAEQLADSTRKAKVHVDMADSGEIFVGKHLAAIHERPHIQSRTLASVWRGQKLNLVDSTKRKETVNAISAKWYKVELPFAEKGQGWVFGAYLQPEVIFWNKRMEEIPLPTGLPESFSRLQNRKWTNKRPQGPLDSLGRYGQEVILEFGQKTVRFSYPYEVLFWLQAVDAKSDLVMKARVEILRDYGSIRNVHPVNLDLYLAGNGDSLILESTPRYDSTMLDGVYWPIEGTTPETL